MDSLMVDHDLAVRLGNFDAAASAVGASADLVDGWAQISATMAWANPYLYWRSFGNALVVTKSRAGFDEQSIRSVDNLLLAIANGEVVGLRYLVFDFAHLGMEGGKERGEGFDRLIAANADLILEAPVIPIAWVRHNISEADLEFAISCSAIIGVRGAHFCFDSDALLSFQFYSALARRIGFVKAERLLENQETLSADDLQALYLVREVVEGDDGLSGIERCLRRFDRRYNAFYGIFRARRICMGRGVAYSPPALTTPSSAPSRRQGQRRSDNAGLAFEELQHKFRQASAGLFVVKRLPKCSMKSIAHDFRARKRNSAPQRAYRRPG